MKKIKVKTPAKINLTLEVLNKRADEFHNIQSIMQAISLYDYLSFEVEDHLKSTKNEIILNGNSPDIPYDEGNIVYKACLKFLNKTNIKGKKISIYIEKNIPVCAGLAGGSSNAAGTFTALNKLFDMPLNSVEIEQLCAELGSDLNFCLTGGTAYCSSRGEIVEKLLTPDLQISLIKPKNLTISAKEAYHKFSLLNDKSHPNNTQKLMKLLEQGDFDPSLIYNSLEKAIIKDYTQLQEIKTKLPHALMSGSGPTFFVLESQLKSNALCHTNFYKKENLKAISTGVETVLE